MAGDERVLFDSPGRFLIAFKNREKQDNADWIGCRILLSNRRLVIASDRGKRVISLDDVKTIGSNYDINKNVAEVEQYAGVQFTDDRGDHIILLTVKDTPRELIYALFQAILDHDTILIKHPAVEGGVVQDTEWKTGMVKIHWEEDEGEEGSIIAATKEGTYVDVEVDDVSEFNKTIRTIEGESRSVLKISHTELGTNVETHLAGNRRQGNFLQSIIERSAAVEEVDDELDEAERQVIMALHSGVPFYDIPEFVGRDVEEVEEIYDGLITKGVLTEIRERREVTVTARGRKIASGAMERE